MVWGGPAWAHSPTGDMTVTKAQQVGPDRVEVQVGITYTNDSDLATEATVTATLTGPGGATVGPVPLPLVGPNSSLYGAGITVPTAGDWAVQVTSTEPAASATGTVSVAAQAAATSSVAPTTVAGSAAPTTAPAASTTTSSTSSDGGSSTGVVVALVLAAVVVVGAVGFVLVRRGSSS